MNYQTISSPQVDVLVRCESVRLSFQLSYLQLVNFEMLILETWGVNIKALVLKECITSRTQSTMVYY